MRTQMGFEPDEDADYRTQLNAAIRKRLLAEIERGQGGGQSVVNNVYGGGAPAAIGGGGIREMAGAGGGDDDIDPASRDYYVDITREDLPDINPLTKKPVGWRKKVHRFSVAHNDDPEKKKHLGTRISGG
jgi:hypothetical protein